jgi:hypothetical protein
MASDYNLLTARHVTKQRPESISGLEGPNFSHLMDRADYEARL